MQTRYLQILSIALLVIGQVLAAAPPLRAAPVAVPRQEQAAEPDAGTVTDCSNDADFSAKLAGGGTVNFNCGTATITLSSTKTIAANTVIDGGNRITLSGGEVRRHFIVNGGATLTLRNIIIADGYANGDGGAIYAHVDSGLVANNVTFRNNRTVVTNSGGAMVVYGAATIRNSRFENNRGGGGGAFYNRWPGSSATIENTIFTNNHAESDSSGWGGAILLWDGAQVTLRDSRIEDNTAQIGGGIYNTTNSQLIIERSRLLRNTASHSGGAIRNEDSLILYDVVLRENEAAIFGGAIMNVGGTVTGDLVRILDNTLTELADDAYGGGIYNESRFSGLNLTAQGAVQLTRSALAGNAAGRGGAIDSERQTALELIGVTLSGNSADEGGAIYSEGSTSVFNSTFSANTSVAPGGAIIRQSGNLDLRFNTFAGNSNPTLDLVVGTLDGPPPITLIANIVAGSCHEGYGSGGHNLETGNTCGFNQGTDKPNTNPLLGPLTNNGGQTQTHMPGVGSPAINAGPVPSPQNEGPVCPATDQRGYLRPAEGVCDIGAVETSAPPLTVTPFPTPTDGPPPGLTPVPETTPQAPGAPPPIVHSQLPNGVKPTISVAPQSGRAGDTITVSGKAPGGFGQVRIVSMYDGRTAGTVAVNASVNGDYSLRFVIPDSTRPGPIELCATVPGTTNAVFACADFTVNPPPPASLVGNLPQGVQARNAQLQLSDGAGRVLYSAPISAAGAFNLDNVTPGLYRYSVVGEVSKPISSGVGNFSPAKPFSPNLDVQVSCSLRSLASPGGGVTATPSRPSLSSKQALTGSASNLAAGAVLGFGTPVFDRDSRPIGIYVSGVRTDVTFEARPQSSGPVQSVKIQFFNSNSQQVGNPITLNAPPWRTTFNVGQLAPSRGTSHPSVAITPIVDGKEECPYYIDIEVIANPFQRTGVQPNALVWDAQAGYYKIQGIIPHIPGVLPADFQLPPPPAPALPFLGRYNNRLNAGIQVVGTLNLEGFAHIQAVRTVAHAYVMNREVIPPGWNIPLAYPNIRMPVANLRETAIPFGPYDLIPPYQIGLPFIEVPVISFFGLVDVTVIAGAGMGAELTISGYVKPLKPAVSATIRPAGSVYAEIGVGLRLLAGLASAGATARVDAELAVPFTVRLEPGPDAEIDACLTLRFTVRAFVSAFWGAARKDATKELAKWAGCVSDLSTASVFQEEPTVPDLLAAPVIAVGANGAHVSAYVENTAAAGSPPNSQVMVRLRPAGSQDWTAPVALSNAQYSAEAPVAALVGPEHWPLVAWVEKKLTYEQAVQLGDNFNAIMQRQEVVYRLYRNGQWEAAVYLTDDQLGDGMPTLAGGVGGAVLAWTRDTDGNWLTRSDQRIAATLFDPATRTFAPYRLLDGGAGALNGDVRSAYDAAISRPYLVWVVDADANLLTPDDRRLAVAFYQDADWVLLNPQPLPPRVDSPAITVGPEGLRLAFLVREPAPDGTVGMVGVNGVLWTARFRDGLWTAAPVLEADGRPVFGEEPSLATKGSESLLLFRRFSQADNNSRFGQLAVSRIAGNQAPARPLYLTDEPRQNWQANLAINPLNGQATIVRVARPALVGMSAAAVDAQTAIAATEAVAAVEEMALSTADDPIILLGYAERPDPALDPLRVSTVAPAAGATFFITATVRNVGRVRADGVSVRLYAGVPGSGTLLETSAVLPNLPFNATASTGFAVTGSGGRQDYYAELVVPGQEGSTANNVATLTLGALSAPVMVDVNESETWVDGLDVDWIAPTDEVVLGYRIWRGDSADGPFDLMGEGSVPGFTDVAVTREQAYCYAVESYNLNTISPRSNVVCGQLAPTVVTTMLPYLRR